MIVDSDEYGSYDMDEELITPSFSCAGYSNVILEFDHYYNYYSGDVADVDVWNGTAWVNKAQWTADTSGHVYLDISDVAGGQSDVKIRWHYYNANWCWYWEVDNVEVTLVGLVYTNDQNVSVPALGTADVDFNAPWNATPGDYLITVTTLLSGDVVPGNNVSTINVHINEADSAPPVIADIALVTSDPKDTEPYDGPLSPPYDVEFPGGWEYFSCTVTDETAVDTVQLNMTYPDSSTHTYTMTKVGDTYYYNFSSPDQLTMTGGNPEWDDPTDPHGNPPYFWHIYANDTLGKGNESAIGELILPHNGDCNSGDPDGKVHFMDLIAVSTAYNDQLSPPVRGWVRADVNNDGRVHFMDLIGISTNYNHWW
jgi:hypothetical protein